MFKRIKIDKIVALVLCLIGIVLCYHYFLMSRNIRAHVMMFLVIKTFVVYVLAREKFADITVPLIAAVGISIAYLIILFPVYIGLLFDTGPFYILKGIHFGSPFAFRGFNVMLSSIINTVIEGTSLCLLFRSISHRRIFSYLFVANIIFNIWFFWSL